MNDSRAFTHADAVRLSCPDPDRAAAAIDRLSWVAASFLLPPYHGRDAAIMRHERARLGGVAKARRHQAAKVEAARAKLRRKP